MDLLFLHTPKFHNYYKPIGEFSFVLLPPIGLLGLADYLVRNGRSARIVHLGVEQYVRGTLDYDAIVREHQPAIVGLDLHWHFQSYDVIEVAREIKRTHPEVGILLGGFTASIFAEEILRDHPFIDFVIRGDAEIPILELTRRFTSDKKYTLVPNLSYREEGAVVSNGQTYIADSAMLDSMCFTDFTLMKDYPTFVRGFSRYVRLSGYSDTLQNKIFSGQSSFPVVLARGCQYECCFCGGCHEAHQSFAGRKTVAARSTPSVVSSICDLDRFGFDAAGLCHDCIPPADSDDYYIAIFEEMKRRGTSINVHIERYSLPGVAFLDAFRSIPGKKSSISFSIHTPNEKLRRRNGLYRYSNSDMKDALALIDSMGIHAEIFFSCGLPFETMDDLEEMARYQHALKKKFKLLRTRTAIIEIEPGSPMSRRPGYFEVQPERSSFSDFYRYHREPGNSHYLEMGYSRNNLPSHDEVLNFYCRHFCEKVDAGRLSPYVCECLEGIRKTGVLSVIDKVLARDN